MIANGNDGMVMPVTPMASGYGNGGFGGGDWGSWIILFLIFGMFGFGGNGFGGGGNQGANPWLLAANNRTTDAVTNGFDNAAITSQLGDINGAITSGFSSMEVANCNRAINQMQTDYQNQIASMNQRFADVTGTNNLISGLSANLQNCCCENRASIADLKYSVATEGCADRNALNLGVRDLLTNNTANTQNILDAIRGISDKLCAQELEAERRTNDSLRQQLAMAQLAASQTAQTAAIEQYVRPNPNPAYIVASPYSQGYGCGCGMA